MTLIPVCLALAAAACAFPSENPPSFRAEDVRPHGSSEPHALVPGQLTWIFGASLATPPGCGAENLMDRKTYKTELCGTRVLVGGIPAELIAVMPGQINLLLPDHPWEDQMVEFQVIRNGLASPAVPVRFGFNRPVVSLPEPALAGMPVWVRVEKPWGTGWLRYPFHLEPWDCGSGWFDVRFQGKDLAPLRLPGLAPGSIGGLVVGLPGDVPREYLHRFPLHLLYALDRPGAYEVRYTEYRPGKGSGDEVYVRSDWARIEIRPSDAGQRQAWLQKMAEHSSDETVELLANYLPALLAARDEVALRLLARYLEHPDELVRRYARYALNYFDPGMLARALPGIQPLRGSVR